MIIRLNIYKCFFLFRIFMFSIFFNTYISLNLIASSNIEDDSTSSSIEEDIDKRKGSKRIRLSEPSDNSSNKKRRIGDTISNLVLKNPDLNVHTYNLIVEEDIKKNQELKELDTWNDENYTAGLLNMVAEKEERDFTLAIEKFKASADKKNAKASFLLGIFYLMGWGCDNLPCVNNHSSASSFLDTIKKENQINLSLAENAKTIIQLIELNPYFKITDKLSTKRYNKLLEVFHNYVNELKKREDGQAQYELGIISIFTRNFDSALISLLKSAENRNSTAAFILGCIYYFEKEKEDKGREWWEKGKALDSDFSNDFIKIIDIHKIKKEVKQLKETKLWLEEAQVVQTSLAKNIEYQKNPSHGQQSFSTPTQSNIPSQLNFPPSIPRQSLINNQRNFTNSNSTQTKPLLQVSSANSTPTQSNKNSPLNVTNATSIQSNTRPQVNFTNSTTTQTNHSPQVSSDNSNSSVPTKSISPSLSIQGGTEKKNSSTPLMNLKQ